MNNSDLFSMYDAAIENQRLRICRNKKKKSVQQFQQYFTQINKSIKITQYHNPILTFKNQNKTMNLYSNSTSRFERSQKNQFNIVDNISNSNQKPPIKKQRLSMLLQSKNSVHRISSPNKLGHQKQKIIVRKKLTSAKPYTKDISMKVSDTTQIFNNQLQKSQQKYAPYLQNAPKYELVKRLKKSFKSGLKQKNKNESPSKQQNIENIIKRKKKQIASFTVYISQFINRLGYPDNVKLFVFNSNDYYIKRILVSNGWIENSLDNSNFYHLKWTAHDKLEKYKFYEGQQFFNHFKNNFNITTKIGLHQNLYYQQKQSKKNFIPRSYDLTFQMNDFLKDYERNSILSLLKKHISYFQTKSQSFSSIQIENHTSSTKQLKQLIKDQNFYHQENIELFKINIPIVIQLCFYLENYLNELQNRPQQYQLQTNTIQKIINYSKLNPPYETYDLNRRSINFTNGNMQSNKIKFNKSFNKYSATISFFTPSMQLMRLLKIYDVYFKKKLIYYEDQGLYNIWILKNCASSKGVGIHLEDKLENILKKKQNRIVQKYIQSSLIFHSIQDPTLNYLNHKKFDIRQWVLVKSFNPLKVYIFNQFYLRICSENYDLYDFKSLSKHLTNYSYNKFHFINQQQSIMHSSKFIQLLKNIYGIDYHRQIKPKIHSIIYDAFSSYQTKQISNRSCFELYGCDFLISSHFKPYLLQINLSPACQQRAQWLKQMLQQMGKGLLQIVLPQEYFSLDKEFKKKWLLIKK